MEYTDVPPFSQLFELFFLHTTGHAGREKIKWVVWDCADGVRNSTNDQCVMYEVQMLKFFNISLI